MIRPLKNSIVRNIKDDGVPSRCVRVISNAPSEVKPLTLDETNKTEGGLHNAIFNPSIPSAHRSQSKAHWYTIRCTCGRERHAFDFFTREGFKAFYPFITIHNIDNGNTEETKESCIPNILFVYGAFEQLKVYVYKNNHLDTKYLRFHYNQKHDVEKEPLIIPDEQMDSLIKTCAITAEDKLIDPYVVEKFKKGKLVKVIEGPYKGVEGVVGRYKGQQRIGIVVEDIFTVTTSYVPKDFINHEEDFY